MKMTDILSQVHNVQIAYSTPTNPALCYSLNAAQAAIED